jgi:hypothetical protein
LLVTLQKSRLRELSNGELRGCWKVTWSCEVPAISASRSVHCVCKSKQNISHRLYAIRSHRVRDLRHPSSWHPAPISWLISVVQVVMWSQLNDGTLTHAISLLHLDCSDGYMWNRNTGVWRNCRDTILSCWKVRNSLV